MSLKDQSRSLYELALDFMLPPQCAGCGRLGSSWCEECAGRVRLISQPVCAKCGLPLSEDIACEACQAYPYTFDVARAWAVYRTELRTAILSMKRRPNGRLGLRLASHLIALYRSQGWRANLVVPIPLAPSRRRQRGYNQVDLIGRPLAVELALPYVEGVLVRRHETEPQFELNVSQRWENMRGAFQANPTPLKGVTVLLVDDIMTTGATLDAAARALKAAGAKRVFALTLTRALFEPEGSIW